MQELVSKLRRKCTARGLVLSDDILFDEIEDAIEAFEANKSKESLKVLIKV